MGNRCPDTTLQDPHGVAVYEGHIYVTDTFAQSITAFPLAKGGNLAPAFTISGDNTALSGPRAIAIDKAGNLFVCGGDQITVYQARARGNVVPIRRIAGTNTGLVSVEGIAVDIWGKIYAANQTPGGPIGQPPYAWGSVNVYAPNATGDVAPIATISGPQTMMRPQSLAVDSSGRIYVSNNPFMDPDGIVVFAPDANGDVAPIASIKDSPTAGMLLGPITIALGDQIYVGAMTDSILQAVCVFPAGADGDVLPLAKLTGSETLIETVYGIAIGFPWYPTPRERRDILTYPPA